jgi:hypothetical protein
MAGEEKCCVLASGISSVRGLRPGVFAVKINCKDTKVYTMFGQARRMKPRQSRKKSAADLQGLFVVSENSCVMASLDLSYYLSSPHPIIFSSNHPFNLTPA